MSHGRVRPVITRRSLPGRASQYARFQSSSDVANVLVTPRQRALPGRTSTVPLEMISCAELNWSI